MSGTTSDRPRARVQGSPVSKRAYALLGVMTAISFAGPFFLAWLLHGGERSGWPPDRTIEWIGAIVLILLFAACFIACLTVRIWLTRSASAPPAGLEADDDRPATS